MSDDSIASRAARREGAKRLYAPPVFTEYGSISKLTQSGGSTKKESGVPQMKRSMSMCL